MRLSPALSFMPTLVSCLSLSLSFSFYSASTFRFSILLFSHISTLISIVLRNCLSLLFELIFLNFHLPLPLSLAASAAVYRSLFRPLFRFFPFGIHFSSADSKTIFMCQLASTPRCDFHRQNLSVCVCVCEQRKLAALRQMKLLALH